MAERIAYILKRRSTLKGQITNLRGLVTRKELDPRNSQLRFKRITEHFHAYEELQIELDLIEETPDNARQFEEVQSAYYELATLIDELPLVGGSGSAEGSRIANSFANSTTVEIQKHVKLPTADLPKFDGDYDKWLTFKNSFKAMIDSRTDIDDLNKFIYLRNCLFGNASQKLSLLDASAENYKKGWDLLVNLYEKKRLLISKHYAGLIDNGFCKIFPMQSNTPALLKLLDESQQHLAMLRSLGVTPDEGMIVSFLERILPDEIRADWEKTLKTDSIPSFADLYKFIHEFLGRQITINRETARYRGGSSNKRANDKVPQNSKAMRSNFGNRALVTGIAVTCSYCGQNHALYRCSDFDKLNLAQRWETVKAKRLCFNCLREHKGTCKGTHCKKCEKYHHTLLHNDKRSNPKSAMNDGANNSNLGERA